MSAGRHDEKLVYTLLGGNTADGSSYPLSPPNWDQGIFQAKIEGTSGAVSATITIYGSIDPLAVTDLVNCAKATLGTISLSGTGAGAGVAADSDVLVVTAPYRTVWAVISSITGTGAKVYLWLGC